MADTQKALDAALKPQGDVTVGDVAMHGNLPTDAMEAVAEIKFKRGIKGESVGSQKRTPGDTAADATEEALPNPAGEGLDADAPSPKVCSL